MAMPMAPGQDDEFNRLLLEAMLEQGDLGAQEKGLDFQMAQANALRDNAPKRMDWASQASRAMGGVAAGLGAKRYAEGTAELGGKRAGIFKGIRDKLRPAGGAAPFGGGDNVFDREDQEMGSFMGGG